jgi:hypothetical protein
MVYRNVYARRGAELTASDRAEAAWLSSGRQATMAGMSAAVLLGSRWVPDAAPADYLGSHHRAPSGIIAHAGAVRDDEVCFRRGIRCTTVQRTAAVHGRTGSDRCPAERHRVPTREAADIALRYPGARNIRRLRGVLALVDGGPSRRRTRVRLILIRGGLPRPITQILVGRRRVDMGWPQWKVGVEYDGPQHGNLHGITMTTSCVRSSSRRADGASCASSPNTPGGVRPASWHGPTGRCGPPAGAQKPRCDGLTRVLGDEVSSRQH